MKKLTLKSKLTTCFILLCLFFAQSCRKDRLNNDNYETDNKKNQKIDEATIQKWMDTNPAAQALTLDWKNAKQTVIEGKNVVRIPTLNIDKISTFSKSLDLKLNKLAGGNIQAGNKGKVADAQNVNQDNSNYYNQHPPEVFFVQENNKEDLHTFILNFVPTNTTKEFGQDGLWTGKLYEWNLKGDTLLVQEIAKNKIVNRYGIKMNRQTATNETLNTINGQLTLNHSNKKISGAWADFWKNVGETIAQIWGDIGNFFGVATYNSNLGRYVWDVIDWGAIGSFFDGIFGGGGGGGSGYGYTGSGYNIYNSYTPGIQNPYDGSYGGSYGWDPYYYSGGGTPSGPNAGTQTFNSVSLSYLLGKLNLTPEQITFLRDNDHIAISLENYLIVNGETYENLEFANWAVKYLDENRDVNFEDLIQGDNARFVLDYNSQLAYPRFTNMLKELKSIVSNDPKILDALKKWSELEREQILEKLEFGKGPRIVVKDLIGRYGYFNASENPNIINIDASWVRGLESANLLSTKQATAFLLGVTVLHEFVHQARAAKGLDKNYEYGTGFENSAFGLAISADNAGKYSYRFYAK